MLQAKQKRAQMARKRILDAAAALFAKQDFDTVRTEDIAKKAGVAKGSVFAHFGDKLHLLAEIGSQEMEQCLLVLERAAEAGSDGDPVEVICSGLDCFLDYYEKQPEFLRLMVDRTAFQRNEGDNSFNNLLRRLHRALKAIVQRGLDEGMISQSDPELTAVALRAYLLHTAVGRLCGEYATVEMRRGELRALVARVVL